MTWRLRCVDCAAEYDGHTVRYRCDCGGTLDVAHDPFSGDAAIFDARLGARGCDIDRSGVWRYRELVLPVDEELIVTRSEGNTNAYRADAISRYTGCADVTLKHEGENPTGSFKDRGMTVALTAARMLGATAVACASTGNTSASLASYAATAGLDAYVFIPAGNIAFGKLSQALAYGATTFQIDGNFDDTMRLVQEVCAEANIYLVNSINPFRIEGQKAILIEMLHEREWDVPDWIVLPGGNLGNSSAIGKALLELEAAGIIDRLPRLAVVQAAGANPLYQAFVESRDVTPRADVETLATAIRIGDPVSWRKCLRAVHATNGVVTEADDAAIMDAKAVTDRAGIGAEPASCATVAGIRRLVQEGVIAPDASVCGVLTGHLLKDPDAVVRYHCGELDLEARLANPVVPVAATAQAVLERIAER